MRVALVTGANRGIGLEISRQLAKKGMTVILTARDENKGAESAERLKGEGLDVIFHQLDVTNQDSINELRRFVVGKFGKISVLVNNAGVLYDLNETAMTVSIDTIHSTMEVNTFGPLQMCRAFLDCMDEPGSIVNVSSTMGQLETMDRYAPAYRMSKTCLNAVTRLISNSVDGKDIKVNCACPGWVKTEMGGPDAEKTTEEGADTIVWLALTPPSTGKFYRDREEIGW